MRVRWTNEAIIDLERVHSFLLGLNPEAAARAGERILSTACMLESTPGLGRPVEDEECRELLVPFGASGYLIRYRVEGEEVVIARVWHGREQRR